MLALKSNAPEIKWIIHNAATDAFARDLDRRLLLTGDLTDNQLAAVRRIVERNAAPAAPVEAVDLAGVARLQMAFATAQGNGIKRPKLYLGTFLFKLAPATGKNKGAIYVTEAGQYLGKVVEGQFHASRECAVEQRAGVVALCSDPLQAAVAFGKETGVCACCGRELTNAESIELGIGPICREKYFG